MTPPRIPERPTLDGLEAKWDAVWAQQGTYAFDRTVDRAGVYSIDTPPPTVSGALHMGSVFGYAQTDSIARYRRMCGATLFYPMGWDDNGLPTERRVQNYYGVRCDPTLPYDPDVELPEAPGKEPVSVARRTFVELCLRLTEQDEQVFEQLWRTLGLSVDWAQTYTTIGPASQRASQRAFLRNLARGEAYAQEAPTLWDVDFRTAVAQAELEDREQPGAYHRIAFSGRDAAVHIETTRPELLPACVALVAHPDDARYAGLVGSTVTTPLFGVQVPVHAHPLADPDKGSGIAMICTFGDTTDVIWWRELDLPVRSVLGRDGRLLPVAPDGVAAGPYAELAGKNVKQAQKRVVELLRESGDLDGEPRPITHPVKFFEKGDRPLEVVTSRQWYVRNGGRDETRRAELLARGKELGWHPAHMQSRYDNWVGGLNGDWLVSRQRFFGVPIPLWYRLDAAGEPVYDDPLLPGEQTLPVDPSSDRPDGFGEDQRGVAGGFVGDPDVMDTWATSSLTPQIAGRWEQDPDLFARVFPMDLRPQGPEIIRTWLFSTVVRSHLEHDELPWRDTMINGWVLDPDRKKMAKSKGNVVTPQPLLEQYGADGVRYWACSGRPGTDTAVDAGQLKNGRRLAVKLLNASKFALAFPVAGPGEVTEPLDVALLTRLSGVVREATAAFDGYDYARALERTEAFFWTFCDDYIELVKTRAYGEGPAADSARRALRTALDVLLRLFAPVLPFAAEEVWSWWRDGSVHRAAWPGMPGGGLPGMPGEGLPDGLPVQGDGVVLDVAAQVLSQVRKAKSQARVSMRTPVVRLVVRDTADRLALLRAAETDLRNAALIGQLDLAPGVPHVEVELGQPPAKTA